MKKYTLLSDLDPIVIDYRNNLKKLNNSIIENHLSLTSEPKLEFSFPFKHEYLYFSNSTPKKSFGNISINKIRKIVGDFLIEANNPIVKNQSIEIISRLLSILLNSDFNNDIIKKIIREINETINNNDSFLPEKIINKLKNILKALVNRKVSEKILGIYEPNKKIIVLFLNNILISSSKGYYERKKI